MAFVVSSNKIEYEENGRVLAQVDFPGMEDGAVNICHTYVDEALRGRGIAGRLMERAAEELRRTKRKAVPTCSYAVSWFEKHKEYSDLLQEP